MGPPAGTPPAQLPLDLGAAPALSGRDNYFVSEANALAFRMIDTWQDWPQHKLIVTGAAGAGKSHLARVWAEMVGGTYLAGSDLPGQDIAQLAQAPVVLDDLERIVGNTKAETELFHLHNLMAARGHPLLMTARIPPNRMQCVLPDLQSRLGAASLAHLEAPDDALLSALIVKLFADRQIAIPPRLLNYVLPRLDRSFRAAQDFVAQMDQRALAESRPIGKKLARDVLDGLLDNQG